MLYETLRAVADLPGLYHLRRAKSERAFFTPSHRRASRCWGIYDTFAQAEEEASRRFGKASYDDPAIVNNSLRSFMTIHLFDWPAIFHIDRAIRERGARSLVDLGGHIGVKYYAFRSLLSFPPGFRWSVVESPSMVEAGRQRQADLGAGDELGFHEELGEAGEADILYCSGSLQYVPLELKDIVQSLGAPATILLNKVPVAAAGQGFFTLDNLGHARVPYRVFDRDDLDAQLKNRYTAVSRWDIPYRDFSVPFTGQQGRVSLTGSVWEA